MVHYGCTKTVQSSAAAAAASEGHLYPDVKNSILALVRGKWIQQWHLQVQPHPVVWQIGINGIRQKQSEPQNQTVIGEDQVHFLG